MLNRDNNSYTKSLRSVTASDDHENAKFLHTEQS